MGWVAAILAADIVGYAPRGRELGRIYTPFCPVGAIDSPFPQEARLADVDGSP